MMKRRLDIGRGFVCMLEIPTSTGFKKLNELLLSLQARY